MNQYNIIFPEPIHNEGHLCYLVPGGVLRVSPAMLHEHIKRANAFRLVAIQALQELDDYRRQFYGGMLEYWDGYAKGVQKGMNDG